MVVVSVMGLLGLMVLSLILYGIAQRNRGGELPEAGDGRGSDQMSGEGGKDGAVYFSQCPSTITFSKRNADSHKTFFSQRNPDAFSGMLCFVPADRP